MVRATQRRLSRFPWAGVWLWLALCVGLAARTADKNAAAQAGPTPATDKSIPYGPFQRGPVSALDRVTYAVEGAESSHGADPQMWGSDPNGPQGPMQVSAGAAEDVGGGNRFDERENRVLGRAYLALMYRRYGSWPDAVAAYNWGPGHMDAWINGGRPFEKFPLSVERYRVRVLVGSSLRIQTLGRAHLQPRHLAADPYNGRAAAERLYTEIMRMSETVAR